MRLALPQIEFSQHRLENGLEVLLHHDATAPLVHVTVHYRVGSSYEQPGRSGFAHLFEHMMFQGSANVPANEHGRLVDAAGGRWNATTSKDRTNYFETLPSSGLSLGLWLEADRMRWLSVTEENFENQRQTVLEEKKQSYDNRPYGASFLRFDELCYTNWAYGHPVIGSESDLLKAGLDDIQEFHQHFYKPSNATLVVSGDFSGEEALDEIDRFFGPAPVDGPRAPLPDLDEPVQTTARHEVIIDPLAALPSIQIGYHMPAAGQPDSYALTMLALALATGDSSRLRHSLVHDRNWVTSLSISPNGYRGTQIFTIWMQVQKGVEPERVSSLVVDELARLPERPLSAEEMEKTRNQALFRLLEKRRTVSGVAESLARLALLFEDPGRINREAEAYLRVEPEDIQQAAGRALLPEKRNVLVTLPTTSRDLQ